MKTRLKKVLTMLLIILMIVSYTGSAFAKTYDSMTEAEKNAFYEMLTLFIRPGENYEYNGTADNPKIVEHFLEETGWQKEDLEELYNEMTQPENANKFDEIYDEKCREDLGVGFNTIVTSALWGGLNSLDPGYVTNDVVEDLSDKDIFGSAIDGIAGILFYGVKILPAIVGKVLSMIMDGVSGEKITVYNVLFNKVDLTNINFFENASGANATTMNNIRNSVAVWYTAIRNISAVILILILIYVGIRMAISTVAEDRAKYKTMFVDWLTSLCILFVLNYIMIFTININNSLVDLIQGVASEQPDMTAVEDKLWSDVFGLSFVAGLANSVAFMMLIGMSFVFFFAYIKRMITLAFLIIIAPLITVTYSIDKMGDGKSQALNTWLKEFIYNILIQPFQCIIYLALASTVLQLIVDNGLGSVSLINVFIAIYVLMFTYQAEEIVKKIFGFDAQSMGKTIATAAVTGALIGRATGLFNSKQRNKPSEPSSQYRKRPAQTNQDGVPEETGGSNGTGAGETSVGEEAGANAGAVSGSEAGANAGAVSGSEAGASASAGGASAGASSGASGGAAAGAAGGAALGVLGALVGLNVAGGMKVAGAALGLSTGDLTTGIAGYNMGSAATKAVRTRTDKSREKVKDYNRRAVIANNIDNYQDAHQISNEQVMQEVENWLDGISMPTNEDDAGMELYQHLMQEREELEKQGQAAEAVRERLIRVVEDSLSGAQSRQLRPSLNQKIRGSRFYGRINDFVNRRIRTTDNDQTI